MEVANAQEDKFLMAQEDVLHVKYPIAKLVKVMIILSVLNACLPMCWHQVILFVSAQQDYKNI